MFAWVYSCSGSVHTSFGGFTQAHLGVVGFIDAHMRSLPSVVGFIRVDVGSLGRN